MARPQTPQGSVRQRKPISNTAPSPEPEDDKLVKVVRAKVSVDKENDYKIVLVIITILAFVTRFWGISHPDEVVFDEVHFGKVRRPCYAFGTGHISV